MDSSKDFCQANLKRNGHSIDMEKISDMAPYLFEILRRNSFAHVDTNGVLAEMVS